ncbi:uncharacterized protein LOC126898496 isoform X2 [Daktulosphaira vitifoliae]|uniref:uncharacterized protein LOC126898496 isoform X2 n=1 Tax=Daktulosphaira vitifoliae TaxID=58002 RepID=UPI0021AAD119|nr:uncharacterized protein LOC126898496 isoform X2 [Daktulosphaira vitifoliae]
MFSLTLVKFSVLIFCVILCTKSKECTKKQANHLDKLLMYSGWKNLNMVDIIKYNGKTYHLKHLIKTPTNRLQCKTKVRALTIFLGCTYAKVINNFFSIIINCLQICKNKMKERNYLINENIYTERFINVIVPIAKLMKGAMDALDSLHWLPWADFKEKSTDHYLMSPLLRRIGDFFDKLNERNVSRYDIFTYSSELETIYIFSKKLIKDLKYEIDSYCKSGPYNQNYLWDEWIQEFNAIITHDEKLVFLKFLNRKFKQYVEIVIIKYYFQLGFKFDPITEETYLPISGELIIQD